MHKPQVCQGSERYVPGIPRVGIQSKDAHSKNIWRLCCIIHSTLHKKKGCWVLYPYGMHLVGGWSFKMCFILTPFIIKDWSLWLNLLSGCIQKKERRMHISWWFNLFIVWKIAFLTKTFSSKTQIRIGW